MMATSSSVWGQACAIKATKFEDIVKDQTNGFGGDFEAFHFNRLMEDEDFALAMRIQNEELANSSGGTMTEDEALAEIMQKIENEESSYNTAATWLPAGSTDKFEKVSVQSSGVSAGKESMTRALPVVSSEFSNAMELETSLHNSSRDIQSIFKHDPLLQSLSNSASLSELDGMGDLLGSKLLVNNTVANSLKTFVHKNEDRQNQMKFNKSKKAAAAAAMPLKPSVTPVAAAKTAVFDHRGLLARSEPEFANATEIEEDDVDDFVLV